VIPAQVGSLAEEDLKSWGHHTMPGLIQYHNYTRKPQSKATVY